MHHALTNCSAELLLAQTHILMLSVDLILLALPAVAAVTRAATFCSMCLQTRTHIVDGSSSSSSSGGGGTSRRRCMSGVLCTALIGQTVALAGHGRKVGNTMCTILLLYPDSLPAWHQPNPA
jgi:hypothetical protein